MRIAAYGLSALALTAAMAGTVASTAAAQETLVINSFGGAYEDAHRELVIEPFEEMYDVDLQVVTAYSADMLSQLRAQAGNPQFDVAHFSGGQEVIAAEEGLLEPISRDELEYADELYDFAVEGLDNGVGPVYSVAAVGMLYNTEALETAPASWQDLWNDDYAGHIVLTDISNTYGLLGLLMINQVHGGDLDNIQPGLDAVSELLDRSVIVRSSPEIQQNFAQNDAWIAPYAQDYGHTLREAGLPIDFVQPEEGSPAVFITANVVAGRENTDLAKKFVDFSLRAEAQIGWAEALRYSPTNRTAELPEELAAQVLYGEEAMANLVTFDPQVVNDRRSEWTDMWNRMITQ
ncbi:ABC transporter substrate-binding protein [Fodinicurvata sp. EGI_FJ10296]|uniref:ABC transporter substrate-binding protein n=1 Tax=Fodinicurvata sp. EGI_FJ10296 TaxID=3231908 RepID=UPI0034521BE4